jgi:general secretion pathway protein I
MSRPRSESAFSLVEALVALAVFASAGVALVQLQSHSLNTFARVETIALADLVAQNRVAEVLAATSRPDVGTRVEEISFAGRTWSATTAVVAIPGAGMRRVSVAVGAPNAAPAATAHAFFAATAPPVSAAP